MNNKRLMGASAALLFLSSLHAETTEAVEAQKSSSGFYVGASAARTEHDAQGEGNIIVAVLGAGFAVSVPPSSVQKDEEDIGWSLTLGYRINRYLAAEIAYYDFGKASVLTSYNANTIAVPLQIDVRSEVEAFGPGVSVLGTLPLGSFELFARGGMLFVDEEITRRISNTRLTSRIGDEVWTAGVGARWNFTSRWSARLEYQITDDIRSDTRGPVLARTQELQQISLGLLVDF